MARLTPERRIARSLQRLEQIQADMDTLRKTAMIYDYHIQLAEKRLEQAAQAINALSGQISEKGEK